MALEAQADKTINSVLGIVVILAILGGTIALVFTNLNTVVSAFEDYTGDNAVLQALVPVFGLVVGIGIVLGLAKLVRRAV